jgi:hypothetical protein
MPTALITTNQRIAHNGWPHDSTRLRRRSAMNERLPGGARRASPAAVSNAGLRHHRPRHRGDDTHPNDHARPTRTEQATRGAADQDARASSNRRVVTARTTNRPARRAPRAPLPHDDETPVSGRRLDRRLCCFLGRAGAASQRSLRSCSFAPIGAVAHRTASKELLIDDRGTSAFRRHTRERDRAAAALASDENQRSMDHSGRLAACRM